jgi:dihydrolipoamide dehydrogenase
MEKLDLTIIGSGPGGYIAAIRAAQLGMRVAVVERKELGGLCLNLGCIPSKAILKSAELFTLMKQAAKYGLRAQGVSANYAEVVARSRRVAERLSKGVEFLMKKNKVTTFKGTARIADPERVLVQRDVGQGGDVEIPTDRIIVATGTDPRTLPILPYDGRTVVHSDQAILLPDNPSSVAVIGGGAVGVEFAYWYNAFGSDTTIVEIADQLLPFTDKEVADLLARSFKRQGIKVLTSAKLKSATRSGAGGMRLCVDAGGKAVTVDASRVLVAVGRDATVAGLGIQDVGVELENGYLRVDERYRTACPSVYAVGDVNGPPLLAHVASAEGVAAVEMMAGMSRGPVDPTKIPSCIYCQPEVASIGMTETAAAARGISVKVGRFPLRASGRAIASGEEEGLVKLVAEARCGGILGAHIIGKGATELIAEMGLARTLEATARDIQATVHAHPTLAESIGEAALAIDAIALNL